MGTDVYSGADEGFDTGKGIDDGIDDGHQFDTGMGVGLDTKVYSASDADEGFDTGMDIDEDEGLCFDTGTDADVGLDTGMGMGIDNGIDDVHQFDTGMGTEDGNDPCFDAMDTNGDDRFGLDHDSYTREGFRFDLVMRLDSDSDADDFCELFLRHFCTTWHGEPHNFCRRNV